MGINNLKSTGGQDFFELVCPHFTGGAGGVLADVEGGHIYVVLVCKPGKGLSVLFGIYLNTFCSSSGAYPPGEKMFVTSLFTG